MANKSKLTDAQWRDIEIRIVSGESMYSVAKEYGITYNGIKKRIGSSVVQSKEQIKSVANMIVSSQTALSELPISSQVIAINLAERLKSISEHLAGAAQYGAMTAHRLSGIANAKVQMIDDVDPSQEDVTMIHALTRVANDASRMGLDLLQNNKDINRDPPKLNELTDDELIAIATSRD